MAQNELRNQEINRHEEVVDRNVEDHQDINLEEKRRGISAANQNSSVARIVNIVMFIFGALELLLVVRFFLQLVGVNAGNSFAVFIYTLSAPFVALFTSLLQNPVLSGTSILEITTIIAMLVWGIVAWLVTRLIWLALSRPR